MTLSIFQRIFRNQITFLFPEQGVLANMHTLYVHKIYCGHTG